VEESYDSTWYDYDSGFSRYIPIESLLEKAERSRERDEIRRKFFEGIPSKIPSPKTPLPNELKPGIATKLKKLEMEIAPVADIYATSVQDQREIDAAVREAIAKPRREAEIAARVAAVEKLGVEDKHEVGTVLRFKRASGKHASALEHTFVAVKIDDDSWLVTGGDQTGSGDQSWDNLLQWMTTGRVMVTNVEFAATWTEIL
jgi:hypothetical protein